MRLFALSVTFGLAAIGSAQYPGSAPAPAEYKKGFDSITQREARAYLTFLATKCEGRGTGQPGFQKAADYVAANFKLDGLKPMGDNGTYFQSTTFYRGRFTESDLSLSLGGKTLATGKDVQLRATSNIELSGKLVLVRALGASATLADPDALRGKIVIADVPKMTRQFRNQLYLANSAAVFTIQAKPTAITWDVSQTKPAVRTASNATGTISMAAAMQLLKAAGGAAALKETVVEGPAKVTSYDSELHLVAKRDIEEVKVSNVVGLFEGSDPTLKAEVVGVGGHLDHLGKRGDVVYPGADDDGSGSTAVLCIAKALSVTPVKPKRSILLMTFFGEEMGLLGSRFLSENPPIALTNMVSELQMDMVARDSYGPQNGDAKRIDKLEENLDTMRLVGSKRISTELDHIIQEQNRYIGFKFKYDAEDVYTRSDHYNFARHGVPIAFLFDGFTPDYHQPTDTVDKIDFLKLTNAAKLYYLTAMTIANLDHRPVHDVQ